MTVLEPHDPRRTCRATILLNTSSLILSSTSNSDSCLSASVLAARTSLDGETYWGKSRTWRNAMGSTSDTKNSLLKGRNPEKDHFYTFTCQKCHFYKHLHMFLLLLQLLNVGRNSVNDHRCFIEDLLGNRGRENVHQTCFKCWILSRLISEAAASARLISHQRTPSAAPASLLQLQASSLLLSLSCKHESQMPGIITHCATCCIHA